MSSEQFEEKNREISEAAQSYHAWHPRNIAPRVVSFALIAAVLLAYACALQRYRDPKGMLLLFVGLLGVLLPLAWAERAFYRRWHSGDPRLRPTPLTLSRRAKRWQWGLFFVLTGTAQFFIRGFMAIGGPRFASLGMMVYLVLYFAALNYVVYRLDGVRLWRHQFPHQLAVALTLLYSVAVAAGLPQPYGDLPGILGLTVRLCWCLLLVVLLGSVLSVRYSQHQFGRLQQLVSDPPPPASTDGTD